MSFPQTAPDDDGLKRSIVDGGERDRRRKIFMWKKEPSNGGEYPKKSREAERDFTIQEKEYRAYFLQEEGRLQSLIVIPLSSVGGEGLFVVVT
ncbi:hypothetical protein ACLOJK_003374 [Asimina triloba]